MACFNLESFSTIKIPDPNLVKALSSFISASQHTIDPTDTEQLREARYLIKLPMEEFEKYWKAVWIQSQET